MKRVYTLFVLLAFFCSVKAQENSLDSMKAVLRNSKADSTKVLTLCAMAKNTQLTDTISCNKYLQEALDICKNTGYDYGYGKVYLEMGNLLETSKFGGKEAQLLYSKAKEHFEKVSNDNGMFGVGLSIAALGGIFELESNYEESINYTLAAIDIFKKINTVEAQIEIADKLVAIGLVYHRLSQYAKGIIYFKKALDSRKDLPGDDADDLIQNYLCLAYEYAANYEFAESRETLNDANIYIRKTNLPVHKMEYFEILGVIEYRQNNFSKALEYNMLALSETLKTGNIHEVMVKKFMIAQTLREMHNFKETKRYLLECLPIAIQTSDKNFEKNIYAILAKCEEETGDKAKAYTYLKAYSSLNDSLQKEQTTLAISELDTKYQTLQKEKQIVVLEKDKQKQRILIAGLIAGLGVLFIMGILAYRYFRISKRITENEILQLQQEKQLVAINSIMEGQEAERIRMAKDLHDGLGGILSGIKLNLSSAKENVIIPGKGGVLLNKSIIQLDGAISEMRRVAHNMMPETLLKFGLAEAIRDYCDGINESNILKMKFTWLGEQQKLERSVEVILYRIVQELSTNAIKHAEAKHIFIQLASHEKGITLTVEDDGKGFDTEETGIKKGAGLQNVQSRIDYLKGNYTIASERGEGTSINIEIPV